MTLGTRIVVDGDRKTTSHSSTTVARSRNTARSASEPGRRLSGQVDNGRKSALSTSVRRAVAAAVMLVSLRGAPARNRTSVSALRVRHNRHYTTGALEDRRGIEPL